MYITCKNVFPRKLHRLGPCLHSAVTISLVLVFNTVSINTGQSHRRNIPVKVTGFAHYCPLLILWIFDVHELHQCILDPPVTWFKLINRLQPSQALFKWHGTFVSNVDWEKQTGRSLVQQHTTCIPNVYCYRAVCCNRGEKQASLVTDAPRRPSPCYLQYEFAPVLQHLKQVCMKRLSRFMGLIRNICNCITQSYWEANLLWIVNPLTFHQKVPDLDIKHSGYPHSFAAQNPISTQHCIHLYIYTNVYRYMYLHSHK